MRLASALLIYSLVAIAQTPAPAGNVFIKGKAVASAPATVAAPGPQIARSSDGKWRCVDPAGKPCTADQLQVMQAAMKGRSNIKNNLAMNPDGTVQCTASGKPCSDAEMQSAVAELSKAAQKGGRNEN